MMTKSILGACFLIAFTSAVACGDDDDASIAEEVFNANCADICEHFNECVADIDVDLCIDECDDASDASDAFEDQTETCEDCLDGRTCSEAEVCWSECIAVPSMGR